MPISPQRTVPMASLPNFRDLGGSPTPDGVVRTGLLFRSDQLSDVVDADRATLAGYGLTTVYDLRTVAEAQAGPDPELPGARNVHLDVLADAELAIPANLAALFSDPTTAAQISEQLAAADVGAKLADTYRGLVSYGSARASYRELYLGILTHPGPALFHCTAGKDRTGWAAAALLSLLGVDHDDVYADYLLTNELLVPSFASTFDAFAAAGGDRSLLLPVLGVDERYLDAAFEQLAREYGSVTGYFADGLGIDAGAQRALRTALVQVDSD